MIVDSNIDEVIEFLKKKKEEGYQTVEIIDNKRVTGWFQLKPTIEFIFNRNEPKVVGINVRNRN